MHLQTQFGEDQCTQFRVIVVIDTARPLSQTQRQDRLQYTAPLASAQSNYSESQLNYNLIYNLSTCQKLNLT